jgi:hypothetical protein
LDENTQTQIASSLLRGFYDTLQIADTKRMQTVLYRLVFMLDIFGSLLRAASAWSAVSLRTTLLATLFDARINTKFFSHRIILTDTGMDQDTSELTEEAYTIDRSLILKYAPIAQHSRILWDSSKSALATTISENMSGLTNTLRNRALEDLSEDQLYRYFPKYEDL